MKSNNILTSVDSNVMKIFGSIFRSNQLTITGLMELTQMPRTTLNRSIKELLECNLIRQEGTEVSTGGRPPALFSINPDGFSVIGMELSRSNIRIVICNASLEPLWIYDIPIQNNSSPSEVFPKLFNALHDAINSIIPDKHRLIGIGIGSVGPLDLKRGVLLNPSSFPNLGWNNINLVEMFESQLNIPAFVANGANTAVTGEYASNVKKGIHSTIYLNVGVGIRCGVISKGILLGGDSDTAGAFGHMIIEPGGRSCYCGNYGCIESYATIPAIVKAFHEEIRKGKESVLMSNIYVDEIQFKDICAAAQSSDLLALQVLGDAATYMGIATANIINILKPQMIVIGGAIPDSSPHFYEQTVKTAKKMIYNPGHMNYIFSPPALGHNTIAVGAAALVISDYINKGA